MISIGSVTSGQMASYYSKDDYYFKQEDTGLKTYSNGPQAKNFEGLSISEKKLAFNNLSEQRELKAKDITFSPPKSVSLMFAGNDEKQKQVALESHQTAVRKTMLFVEQNLFYVQKKRHNQVEKIQAGGMVAMGIEHSLSRNMDPQLHTHVLIANAGYIEGEDQSRSVNFKNIFDFQHKLDLIYKTYIRADLENNGYKTRKTQDGFELADITDQQVMAFSTRKAQVDLNLQEMGLTRETATAEQRQKATLKNRLSKKNANNHNLNELWRSQLDQHNINIIQHETIEVDQNRDRNVYNIIHKGYQDYIGREAISTKHQAINNILKFAEIENGLDESVPLITLDDIEKYLPRVMKLEKMVRLPGQIENNGAIKEKFVSEKLLIADVENQQYLHQGKSIYKGKTIANIEQQVDRNAKVLFDFKFEGEQRTAAIGVLKSEDFLVGVQGDPGTGKTTLLKAVVSVQGTDHIIAIAKAGASAQKLGDEIGVQARTIDRFVLDFERREKLLNQESISFQERKFLKNTTYVENLTRPGRENPALIVVDESSMNGDLDLNRLCKIAEKTRSKIVLTGDIQQLPGVAAGESFKKMQTQGMKTFNLKEIRRQRGEVELEAVQAITMRKNVQESVNILQRHPDIIREEKTDKKRLERIKQDYIAEVAAGRHNPFLITSTNKDKDELNRNIRAELKALGRLDLEGETHSTIINRNKIDTELCPGDRIVFLKNDNEKIIKTSSDLKILNGNQAVIEQIKDGQIYSCLVDDEGRKTKYTATFDIAEYNHLDYSYALSTYKSQGQSVERNVMYHTPSNSPLLSTNEFLVGISRNKERLNIYTDDIQKMVNKASQWVNKNDALFSYKYGFSIANGQSKRLKRSMYAVYEKLRRDSEVSEERLKLVEQYGLFSKAPKKECTRINELWEDSRQRFHEDLFKIKEIEPSKTETQTEHHLWVYLEKWEKSRVSAIQRFEQDKSRYRVTNHYKQLKSNDDDLCKKILGMEGNKASDQQNKNIYELVNENLDRIEGIKLFPVQQVLQIKPKKTAVPVPVKEATSIPTPAPTLPKKFFNFPIDPEKQISVEYLNSRIKVIDEQIWPLKQKFSRDKKQEIYRETLTKKEWQEYLSCKDKVVNLKSKYYEMKDELYRIEKKLENHEMADANRITQILHFKKYKKFQKLEEQYEVLFEKKELLRQEIINLEGRIKPYRDKLNTALRERRQENQQIIEELEKEIISIDSEIQAIESDVLNVGAPENKKDFVDIGTPKEGKENQDNFEDIDKPAEILTTIEIEDEEPDEELDEDEDEDERHRM